jgi:glycosyltransferase involved in cell wall biosynthesis
MANQTLQLASLLRQSSIQIELIQVNAPYRPVWVSQFRGLRAVARLLPYLFQLWKVAGRVSVFHIMANSGWSWHLFAAPAVWVGAWRGTHIVLNYRGGEAGSFFEKSFRWIRPTLKRVDQIIVPSAFLENIFSKHGFHVSIVPNIIDLSKFSPKKQSKNLITTDPHIVVPRNLELIYDIPTALHTLKAVRRQFPTARMTIAGSGAELGSLRVLAHELDLSDNIYFTGRLDNDSMAELYYSADVVLNTSLVDNMPISILEALASGIPIVSTSAGGIPYLITHSIDGLLAPIGNSEALADCIIDLLQHPNLRNRLISAGLDKVRQFQWDSVRPKLFAAYGYPMDEKCNLHRAGSSAA